MTRWRWVVHLVPTFRIDTSNSYPVYRQEDLNRPHDPNPGATNVIGDMPEEASEVLEELRRKELEQKAKEEAEAYDKAMAANMEKYNTALNNTFEEVMNGYVSKKKEE